MERSLFPGVNRQQRSPFYGSGRAAAGRPFPVAESGDLNLLDCTDLRTLFGMQASVLPKLVDSQQLGTGEVIPLDILPELKRTP